MVVGGGGEREGGERNIQQIELTLIIGCEMSTESSCGIPVISQCIWFLSSNFVHEMKQLRRKQLIALLPLPWKGKRICKDQVPSGGFITEDFNKKNNFFSLRMTSSSTLQLNNL